MLLNCYYYAPHNHTLLSDHIRRDLGRMAELGTDIVSFCIQESQLDNWHWKRADNMITLAHAAGLKAHLVPNRWAGVFAGWLDGFGRFQIEHPEYMVKIDRENWEKACCLSHPGVMQYLKDNLQKMLDTFAVDGIIWDEPHSYFCHCPACRAAGIDSEIKAQQTFAARLDELSSFAKKRSPELEISCFVQPHDDLLLQALLNTQTIDYLGSDGHVRSEDHTMHRMKTTIFEAYQKYAPLLREAGKKSFFLLEAQRHRDEDLPNYLDNLERAFTLPMDQLMYYYSAHEMSLANEERFNNATWEMIRRLKRKSK